MQNRNLKLTAKGRLWVRSTRVHHNTRTCQQPEAAGCLQEERCLQAAFCLLAGIDCLILFPSVLGLHFHEVFRLIHSRVTGTREVCLVFGGILIQQLVTAGAALMLTPMAGEEGQRGALGCSRLIPSQLHEFMVN